jgi:hypothetical protein
MASGKCSNCGGQLPLPEAGQPFLKCHFCGQVVPLAPPPPPRVPEPQRPQRPQAGIGGPPQIVIRRRGGSPLGSVLFVLFVVFATAGAGILRSVRHVVKSVNGVGTLVTSAPELVHWDSSAAPYPARINGDAVEDFVGHVEILHPGAGNSEELIDGFDGATLNRLWTAGPFGDSSDTRGLAFAVAGSRAIVTDSRSVAHILDVTSGREVARVNLSDRAKSICAAPASSAKSEVWIEVSDEQNVLVDLAAATLKKAPRPPYCGSDRYSTDDIYCHIGLYERTEATCKGVDSSFRVPGFRGERMLSDGDATVVVGTKSPGSQVPTAVGYDPKGKHVLWQRTIPQGDLASVKDGLGLTDLVAGVLVSQVELTSGIFHLSAIDAKSGSPLWQTEVPHSKDGSSARTMKITPTRVYLPHWTYLDVFDARSGRVIGTIGK